MKSYNFCSFQIGWVETPVIKESLTIREYDSDTPLAKVFGNLISILKGPDDLLFLRDSIIASISFGSVGLRDKEFSTGLLR